MTVATLLKAHGLKSQDDADELLVKLAQDRDALLDACKVARDDRHACDVMRRRLNTAIAQAERP